jgi:glycine/serine hydroxymethyltransferase
MYFNSMDKLILKSGRNKAEMARQEHKIELIASENFTSSAVRRMRRP